MAKKSFSISSAVSYGFKTMKKNFKFFLVLLIIVTALNFLPSMIAGYLEEGDQDVLRFIVLLAGWLIQLAVSLGIIGIALRIHDKKKFDYKHLFDNFSLVIPYLFGSIIYGLIVLVGFILLVVPGIIWGIKFRYFTYFMVDKKMGPIDAFKASAKLTNGNKWNLFLLIIILAAINILGLLALVIGLFVTVPISIMSEAYVYRKLSGK